MGFLRYVRTLLFRPTSWPTSWKPSYSYTARHALNGAVIVGYLMKRRNLDGVMEYREMTGYEAEKYIFENPKRIL